MSMANKGSSKQSMENRLALGMCQISQGYDIEANIDRACALLGRAAEMGAKIACLPEMFTTPYEPMSIRKAAPYSESALGRLQDLARDRGMFIVAGSMPWPSGQKRLFNRALVIDPSGAVVHRHDKIHLFDCTPPGGPKVVESDTIVPGDTLGDFATPWGKAAVIVCYDIRFTPLTQILADRDVRLLFVPAAFAHATGKAHWEMLVRLRAVELQAFVAGVQPANNPQLGYVPWGHSIVASPWGDVLVDAAWKRPWRSFRSIPAKWTPSEPGFPCAPHRRDDLYETRWKG